MMPRHSIPKSPPLIISKRDILSHLSQIDLDIDARKRILDLENKLRARIESHIATSTLASATLESFSTSPFVLMIHCLKRRYSRISEIEKDILPAKEFSSMETSAGRMIEDVALPVYHWHQVPSAMQSTHSAIDGQRIIGDTLYLATLKSGPRCLNDEMSENFADTIIAHFADWAGAVKKKKINFTYGVLYGTPKISNKKDWHILRNVVEKMQGGHRPPV